MRSGWRRSWRGSAALAAALLAATALAGGAPGPARAASSTACKLGVLPGGEFKVAFDGNRPVMAGEIDGHPVRVLIDTGAQTSLVLRASARRLGLTLNTINGARVYGAGGGSDLQVAVARLRLAGVEIGGMRLLVAGEVGADVDMLLGEDFLSHYDLELDLAHGAVRLLSAAGCQDSDLPYWAAGYDEAPLVGDPVRDNHIVVPVKLNGRSVRAILDSGASASVGTPATAAAAHVVLAGPVAGGPTSRGLGGRRTPVQVVRLDSFQIGAETVQGPSLRFADLFSEATYGETGSILSQRAFDPQTMLLGADFLRAHRVVVSPRRHKIFFTYNGGPVFAADRGGAPPTPPAAPPPPATASTGG